MNRATDAMTGFFTGEEFYTEAERLIAKGGGFTIAMIDLDNLLVLNRDFGQEAGDAVIKTIAKHYRAIYCESVMAFRTGGDEFVLLLPQTSKEEAFLLAEALRKAVCEEKLDFVAKNGGRPLTQSISIGIATYPDDGGRAADVVRSADSAMVRAKRTGRNRVCLAKEEKLLPKTSHYTQAQLEKLTALSKKLDVGEAALMREALDGLLRKYDE